MNDMDKIVAENLFLLEFLVDKVDINPGAISREISDVAGETCVSVKFLDNDPLDICEADFTPKRDYALDAGNMKNGKSCLFALSPQQANVCTTKFDVDVAIFKKLATGMLPDKLQIGSSTVSIVSLFNEVIQLLKASLDPGTVSRTLKDTFPVVQSSGHNIGSIIIFMRMSCFGKLIVTQFQMNLDDKSVFFKDKDGKSLYKYRKASRAEVKGMSDSEKEFGDSSRCDKWNQAIGRTPPSPGGMGSECTPYSGGQQGAGPCNECGQYDAAGPPAICPPDKSCYQEIGAEMNGNALTIRVHKNKGYSVKRLGDNDSDFTRMKGGGGYSEAPRGNRNAGCGCQDEGRPTQNDACCCFAGQPQKKREDALCFDKQVLSLKPADDPNNPFSFKMSGCGNATNQNVTVVPPTNTRPDGMQVTEIADPNKDVFILRIGRKTEGTDKKANLELELVTPKADPRKPIPKKETRETQYLDSDCPPSKKKKGRKGGKGGGGKGGKGGAGGGGGGGGGKGGKKGKKGGNGDWAGKIVKTKDGQTITLNDDQMMDKSGNIVSLDGKFIMINGEMVPNKGLYPRPPPREQKAPLVPFDKRVCLPCEVLWRVPSCARSPCGAGVSICRKSTMDCVPCRSSMSSACPLRSCLRR